MAGRRSLWRKLRDFPEKALTFSPLWDTIIRDTARTEQEYPAAPPDREARHGLEARHGQEQGKTAPAAGPETGAVPFPQQKA